MQAMNEKDRQLREAVARQLEWDPQVTSNDISVAATDHVITLTGFVHNYNEKYAAENAAKSVYGVKAVANDIEVKLKAARTDPEIARDVAHAIKLDVTVPDDGIKAAVQEGFVTLEGAVEWNFQRISVETCARNVPGVRGVMNRIVVKPKAVSSVDVLHKIEDALRRSAEVDARRITVSTTNGTVHLHGSVRSWAERDEAEKAAWAAPGVSEVIDYISVVP
ncbi:MAG: BON domain-containing protein [Bryobacteraceae bacterium]|jgi:osmotically-inducible protein OsmY